MIYNIIKYSPIAYWIETRPFRGERGFPLSLIPIHVQVDGENGVNACDACIVRT